MKITAKKLQKMTSEEVYDIIFPSIYQIFNQYKYAEISREDYAN